MNKTKIFSLIAQDVSKFKCLKTLEGHSDWVESVAYSPDGTKIISSSYDKTIKIWDANTGECLNTLEGHSGYIFSLAYSPDGKRIISGSRKKNPGKYFWSNDKIVGEIKIWDANTGECLKTLEGHSEDVFSVAYSPNGTKIISGSGDETIKIWDANTGECLKTLKGHLDIIWSVAFSPDGKRIISGSSNHTIKIWGEE